MQLDNRNFAGHNKIKTQARLMNNSRFSSLIYRIIGKPERWHEDYIDVMNQILDETDSFDDPYNFTELEVGDQIISSLKSSSEALTVFNTLLDKSRFKMIILDEQLKPIYHNQNAEELYNSLLAPNDREKLHPGLLSVIAKAPQSSKANNKKALVAIDYQDENGDQIYLRTIQNQLANKPSPTLFHILMVLDQSHQHNELNPDLIEKYELTDKEQMVLRGLIHGRSIKEIAQESYISDNTVKTHLKSIFRKTDTNSQTSVVRLILTHESQILDSYFEADIVSSGAFDGNTNDKVVSLKDGLEVAYCDYGPKNGRPLIVFHSGYGCRLSVPPDFERYCVEANRRIIIPDRPGTGKTPFTKGHPEGWNERLHEFIDLLELKEYDILGSILGAQMAICFALTCDSRLKKIILNAPIFINNKADTRHLTGILAPSARLVKASSRFAREIYELWLKSVTLNLGTHYKSMLESSLGSAEREQFMHDGTFKLLIDVFKEGASNSIEGMSNEMVFCLSPMNVNLKSIKVPVDVWYGTEDQRLTLEGVKDITKDFQDLRLNVREGYSEHIYYALFPEIIA